MHIHKLDIFWIWSPWLLKKLGHLKKRLGTTALRSTPTLMLSFLVRGRQFAAKYKCLLCFWPINTRWKGKLLFLLTDNLEHMFGLSSIMSSLHRNTTHEASLTLKHKVTVNTKPCFTKQQQKKSCKSSYMEAMWSMYKHIHIYIFMLQQSQLLSPVRQQHQ